MNPENWYQKFYRRNDAHDAFLKDRFLSDLRRLRLDLRAISRRAC